MEQLKAGWEAMRAQRTDHRRRGKHVSGNAKLWEDSHIIMLQEGEEETLTWYLFPVWYRSSSLSSGAKKVFWFWPLTSSTKHFILHSNSKKTPTNKPKKFTNLKNYSSCVSVSKAKATHLHSLLFPQALPLTGIWTENPAIYILVLWNIMSPYSGCRHLPQGH